MSTASRVLSGSDYPVSTAARLKVQQAADELAYTPNPVARALVTRSSRMLGVIVGAITDPYFAQITRGVEDYARRAGYLTIVCNTDRDPNIELAYLRMLRSHAAKGILFAGGHHAEGFAAKLIRGEVEDAVRSGTEVVSAADRTLGGIPFVGVDNEVLLRDLTMFLVSLGHRRIGLVAGPPGYSTSESRLRGYTGALARAGLEPIVYPCGMTYDAGRAAALRIMSSTMPDAVIGLTDEVALGVLSTFRAAGIDVPGEVSIAGVNDTRDAEIMGLTSVAVPMYELGAAAARRMIDPTDGVPSNRIILSHRIVPRETTRAATPAAELADPSDGRSPAELDA